MPTKDSSFTEMIMPKSVLHMDMVNAISKLVDKLHIINALITQMAGVVVEPEGRMVINRFQSTFCGGNVKGDFRGMNLQTILDTLLLEQIHDRPPAISKVLEPSINLTG